MRCLSDINTGKRVNESNQDKKSLDNSLSVLIVVVDFITFFFPSSLLLFLLLFFLLKSPHAGSNLSNNEKNNILSYFTGKVSYYLLKELHLIHVASVRLFHLLPLTLLNI